MFLAKLIDYTLYLLEVVRSLDSDSQSTLYGIVKIKC